MAFLCGNLLLQHKHRLPELNLFAALVLSVICLVCIIPVFISLISAPDNFKTNSKIIGFFVALFCAGALGFLRAYVQGANYLEYSAPPDLMSEDRIVNACVSSLPKIEGDIARFIINPLYPDSEKLKRIRVNAKHVGENYPFIEAGSCWQFKLRLKTTRGLRNEHGFDYELWLYQQSIGATAYTRDAPTKLNQTAYPWLRFRAELAKKIKRLSPENSAVTALVLGLSLGIRDDLNDEQWTVLQNTGTSHLLAISGLHVGVAALCGFYFGKCLWLMCGFFARFRPNFYKVAPYQIGLVIGLICAVFYAALAGFSVPTQRACIMLVVAYAGLLLTKQIHSTTVLSIALLVVLTLDPISALASGTWLSFLAVAVLVMLARRDIKVSQQRGTAAERTIHKIVNLGYLQCILIVILSLPVALSFSQFSLVSPLVNFILIPVFSVSVVPVLLATVVVMQVSATAATYLLHIQHFWLDWIWSFLNIMSNLTFSSKEIHTNLVQCLLLSVFVIPFLLPKGILSRAYALILVLPVIYGFTSSVNNHRALVLTVYDVGQGLAVLIQTRQHQLLYDTGPAFRSGSSAAERVLLPDFKSRSLGHLSALVISHTDNDHAGGRNKIIDSMRPHRIYSPEMDSVQNSLPCEDGTSWTWDEVEFKFLYPFSGTKNKSKNNYSCVLKISYAKHSILLTGDIEKAAEYAMLTHYPDLQADLVFAPHHGSRSSSTPEFVKGIRAKQVIFPTGFANRWRFPKQEIVDRWKMGGAEIYNIADTGQLELTYFSNEPPFVSAWTNENCRYWHQDCA
jgi:competence protein ComEC